MMDNIGKTFGRIFKSTDKTTDKVQSYTEWALSLGYNEDPNPFNPGDILRRKYTSDSDDNLIPGREEFEFVGMKDDMMLLKTLNIEAAYGEDSIYPDVIRMAKKAGYKPDIGQVLQCHYMYANEFEIIGEKTNG